MDIDDCCHEWDCYIDEYLPVSESIQKHHPCKECGLINYRPPSTQLKTGALIVLIKDLFEQSSIARGKIRIYIDRIKQMKRDGVKDDDIIEAIMKEESVGYFSRRKDYTRN
jgi:hypothetical protein